MSPYHFTEAYSIFINAEEFGAWDEHAFENWLRNAQVHSSESWKTLGATWEQAGRTRTFGWAQLLNAVEWWSQYHSKGRLEALGAFMCPEVIRARNHDSWFNSQDAPTKTRIYDTAEKWALQSSNVLESDGLTLLRLAVASENMGKWRNVPDVYVSSMDWYEAMHALSQCGDDILMFEDIERMALADTNATPLTTLFRCCDGSLWNLVRYIEQHTGPGLWMQYAFSNDDDPFRNKRKMIQKSCVAGLDSWALEQYDAPMVSFSISSADTEVYSGLAEHKEWAYRWWLGCVLGMDRAQALEMVRNMSTDTSISPKEVSLKDIDMSMFET